MILRRFMQHVKDQNWFAVALDFVIVVGGVFIGIQVANWNDQQSDRHTEEAYILRLHEDIAFLSADTEETSREEAEQLTRLQEVRDYFENLNDARFAALNEEHCSAIARSHIYAEGIITPPTISELFVTGRIETIQDTEVRYAIVRFQQVVEDISQLRNDLQIDRLLLARTYPEHIKLGLRRWEDSECQFEVMAGDRAFLNDFADNLMRSSAFTDQVIGRLKTLQVDLHELLDTKLGIQHGEPG